MGAPQQLDEAAIQGNATEWEDYRQPICVRQPSTVSRFKFTGTRQIACAYSRRR
jgi:hypothetical protein